MARKSSPVFDADQLLKEFKLYDRAVDVVSCYHWLFTEVAELAATVDHFERYPKICVDERKVLTPDFTVVFDDGAGLAGEVAHISLREESVDNLCRQLQGYSELKQMPGAAHDRGHQELVKVGPVDVLFLNPVSTVVDAARRVFAERMEDPDHPFDPARQPVLVQFSQDGDAYVYLVWPNGNGQMHRGDRVPVYGDINPFVCRPDQFGDNKVQYGFMNDEVPALYMAVRLWTRVLPTSYWGDEVSVPLPDLTSAVRDQHEGHGKTADVRRGMQVLAAAGLAKETEPGREWVVTRLNLRRTDKDLAVAIADRVRKSTIPTKLSSSRRARPSAPPPDQGPLF